MAGATQIKTLTFDPLKYINSGLKPSNYDHVSPLNLIKMEHTESMCYCIWILLTITFYGGIDLHKKGCGSMPPYKYTPYSPIMKKKCCIVGSRTWCNNTTTLAPFCAPSYRNLCLVVLNHSVLPGRQQHPLYEQLPLLLAGVSTPLLPCKTYLKVQLSLPLGP